jgi:DNA-directed RNA polymerase subunit RPC12/RpoP
MTSKAIAEYKCDRCGAIDQFPAPEGNMINPVGWLSFRRYHPTVYNIDLCPQCASKFTMFMDKGPLSL